MFHPQHMPNPAPPPPDLLADVVCSCSCPISSVVTRIGQYYVEYPLQAFVQERVQIGSPGSVQGWLP